MTAENRTPQEVVDQTIANMQKNGYNLDDREREYVERAAISLEGTRRKALELDHASLALLFAVFVEAFKEANPHEYRLTLLELGDAFRAT